MVSKCHGHCNSMTIFHSSDYYHTLRSCRSICTKKRYSTRTRWILGKILVIEVSERNTLKMLDLVHLCTDDSIEKIFISFAMYSLLFCILELYQLDPPSLTSLTHSFMFINSLNHLICCESLSKVGSTIPSMISSHTIFPSDLTRHKWMFWYSSVLRSFSRKCNTCINGRDGYNKERSEIRILW